MWFQDTMTTTCSQISSQRLDSCTELSAINLLGINPSYVDLLPVRPLINHKKGRPEELKRQINIDCPIASHSIIFPPLHIYNIHISTSQTFPCSPPPTPRAFPLQCLQQSSEQPSPSFLGYFSSTISFTSFSATPVMADQTIHSLSAILWALGF